MGRQGCHDRLHLLLPSLGQRCRRQILLERQVDEAVLPATAVEEKTCMLPHVRPELVRRLLRVPLLTPGENALKLPIQITVLDQPNSGRGLMHPASETLEEAQRAQQVPVPLRPACATAGELPA